MSIPKPVFATWFERRYQLFRVEPIAFQVAAVTRLAFFEVVLTGTEQVGIAQRINLGIALRPEMLDMGESDSFRRRSQ